MLNVKYKVVKTQEGDWAIVFDRDGEMVPVAMSIMDECVAWEMARHLNNQRSRSVLFRSKCPDADLVITGGKGFHIRFANGRRASVQWGASNYCDRQDSLRGRDFFQVQLAEGNLKEDYLRKLYPEFQGPTYVNYEQMFADWGSSNAEISPGRQSDPEGWMTPDQIVETLYEISKMSAIEDGKEPAEREERIDGALTQGAVWSIIGKMVIGTTDKDLLDGVSAWKETDSKIHPRIHEWRSYLPEELLDAWEFLTSRERALCFYLCRQQAGAEEWY